MNALCHALHQRAITAPTVASARCRQFHVGKAESPVYSAACGCHYLCWKPAARCSDAEQVARAAAKREREAHWAWRAASVGQLERTLRWRSPGVAASLAQTRDALWAQQAAAPRPSPGPSASPAREAACDVPHVSGRGSSMGMPLRQREAGAARGTVPSASVDGACANAEGAGKVLGGQEFRTDLAAITQADCSDGGVT